MATVQRGHRIVAEPARRQGRQGRGRSSTHGTRASAVALAAAMLASGFEAPGAPCTQHPAEWWYAPEDFPGLGHGSGTRPEDADEAKRLCGLCPAREACLDWVVGVEATLGPQHVHGIAGGLDAEQRRPLVVAQRRLRAGRVAS